MANLHLVTSDKDYTEEEDIICYKNIPNIETAVIKSLEELPHRISTLKLEFCNLTEHQIEILASLLVDNKLIMEVSVNGNPNKAQNFYLLLHDTNIVSLSLKFCSIDAVGIEKISQELYYPFESCLLHLNLSSNSLCNEGVKHVAHFLRINRTLMSLNLADNRIYDAGCLQLMVALQRFRLDFDEIVLRRAIKFEIHRKSVTFIIETPSDNNIASRLKGSSVMVVNHSRNSAKFSMLRHPFMWDNSENNDHVYSTGNDTLINLNLSYNKITYRGLKGILQMLQYQINNYLCDKGISRISTEGNDINDCDCLHILNKVKELLGLKWKKSPATDSKKKNHLSLRKRS